MKKIISLLLCLTLMLTLAVPCFAAGEEHPTIYITGAQTNDLYNADGERIYPLSDDLDAMQIINPALRSLCKVLSQMIMKPMPGSSIMYLFRFMKISHWIKTVKSLTGAIRNTRFTTAAFQKRLQITAYGITASGMTGEFLP